MIETICNTCLSMDRILKPIKPEVVYLFTMLCPEMFSKDYSQYLICWECEFMINRIKLFHAKLIKANNALGLILKGKKDVFEELSRLKLTKGARISIKSQKTPTPPQNTPILPHNTPTLLENTLTLPQNTRIVPQNSLLLPQNTGTIPQNTLLLPQNTRTVPQNSLLLPQNTRTPPENTLQLPQNTRTVPQNSLLLPQNTRTPPENTLQLPQNTQTVPQNSLLLPQNTRTPPENTLTLPQNTRTVPQNTRTLLPPFPSLKEMLAAPLRLDTQPVTIKMEDEDKGSCLDGDYDELIQPSTIEHHATDPLMLPTQNKSEIETKRADLENITHKSIQGRIVIPNVFKYIPQKIFLNTSNEQVPLRGLREPVKVTGSATKLITSKIINPNTINSIEKAVISHPVTVNHNGSNVNIDKPLTKLLETPSKPKELYSIKDLQTSSKDTDEGKGGTGDHDVAKCIILNRTEVNAFRDKMRNYPTYADSQFKCEKCIEWFESEDKLNEHNKKHDEAQGALLCKICEQRFADDHILNEHYKLHFMLYHCVHCPFQHSNRMRVSEHNRKNHEQPNLCCTYCDAKFKTSRQRRQHTINVHAKKIKCEECGKLISRNQMKSHMANVHRDETVQCPICQKKLRKYSLKTHLKTHDETRDIIASCADCGTTYKSKQSYRMHLKSSLKHNTIEKLGLKCGHCNKYFASKHSLKSHVDEIVGIKYICDICKKVCKNKRVLIRHIQVVHEGMKLKLNPVMCDMCGKTYKLKKALEEHINSHLGRRTQVCADCGATFVYAAALFTHRRLVHKVKNKMKTKQKHSKNKQR